MLVRQETAQWLQNAPVARAECPMQHERLRKGVSQVSEMCCMVTQWPLDIKSKIEANTTYQTSLLESSPYPLCFFSFDGDPPHPPPPEDFLRFSSLTSVERPACPAEPKCGNVIAPPVAATRETLMPPPCHLAIFLISRTRRSSHYLQPSGRQHVREDDLASV